MKQSPREPENDGMSAAHTVRLPRFLVSEAVGLGDIVKRITSAAGLQSCAQCERRAAHLNRWLRFAPPGGREER